MKTLFEKTLALVALSSMTFACAAEIDGSEPTVAERVAAEREDGVKLAANTGSLQSSIPDNTVFRKFVRNKTRNVPPKGDLERVKSVSFELIDTCVTPGQKHSDASVEVESRSAAQFVNLFANLPAERKNNGVCASWFNQTTARMSVVAMRGQGATSTQNYPDELNLALRGNLHVTFYDGHESVHQIVLGQGHQIVSNNWWTALEDATYTSWTGFGCWEQDTKYQLCLDFEL